MILAVSMCMAARAQYTFTPEEVVDALEERDKAVENARVEFRRSIYLPPRDGGKLTQIVDDQGKVVREFRTDSPEPEKRFLTRHIMTAVGTDLVRLDNYELKKDPQTGEDFKHWSTTIDWGDERRMTPDDTKQIISIYKGSPDHRGAEIIGNEHALLTAIKRILSNDDNLKLSDLLTVDTVELDGQKLVRLRTNPNAKTELAEIELWIDPAKSFVVRRMYYWHPSKANKYREGVTYYDDVVEGKQGIWYPTRIKRESYRFSGQEKEGQGPPLVKRDEFTITSFEINLTDINVSELFNRVLPTGRLVMDYRVNPDEPITYNTSVEDVEMAIFENAYKIDKTTSSSVSDPRHNRSTPGGTDGQAGSNSTGKVIGEESQSTRGSKFWLIAVVLIVISAAFVALRRRTSASTENADRNTGPEK